MVFYANLEKILGSGNFHQHYFWLLMEINLTLHNYKYQI